MFDGSTDKKTMYPLKRNIHLYVFELVRPRISSRNRGSMLPFPYRGKNQLNIGYQIWWQEAERSMVIYHQYSVSIDLYIHCFCIAWELESCSQSFFLDLFTLPVSRKTNAYMHYLLSIRVITSPKVVESVDIWIIVLELLYVNYVVCVTMMSILLNTAR